MYIYVYIYICVFVFVYVYLKCLLSLDAPVRRALRINLCLYKLKLCLYRCVALCGYDPDTPFSLGLDCQLCHTELNHDIPLTKPLTRELKQQVGRVCRYDTPLIQN